MKKTAKLGIFGTAFMALYGCFVQPEAKPVELPNQKPDTEQHAPVKVPTETEKLAVRIMNHPLAKKEKLTGKEYERQYVYRTKRERANNKCVPFTGTGYSITEFPHKDAYAPIGEGDYVKAEFAVFIDENNDGIPNGNDRVFFAVRNYDHRLDGEFMTLFFEEGMGEDGAKYIGTDSYRLMLSNDYGNLQDHEKFREGLDGILLIEAILYENSDKKVE